VSSSDDPIRSAWNRPFIQKKKKLPSRPRSKPRKQNRKAQNANSDVQRAVATKTRQKLCSNQSYSAFRRCFRHF
jgi:hypothetical protein